MKKYAVIYLDLLGSKSFLKEDFEAALGRHRDFHEVLKQVQLMERLQPLSSMPEGPLKRLAERNASDSFSYLLPMSDSVFILSEEPEKIAEQLSTFLSKIFLLSGGAYSTPDCSNVLNQRIANVHIDEYGEVERNYGWEKWYPVLFRGGISYGEAEVVKTPAICLGRKIRVPNVIGKGVVQAVGLEQRRLPGPRVLCDREFVDRLGEPATKYLRKEGDAWELLWPGFNYLEDNDERSQSYVLGELFRPASALWGHFSGKNPERHYQAFLELIVRSHLAFAECASDPELVNEYLHQELDEAGLKLCASVKNSQLVFPDTR